MPLVAELTVTDPTGIYTYTTVHVVQREDCLGSGDDRNADKGYRSLEKTARFYPNPTNNTGLIQVEEAFTGAFEIIVVDALGKKHAYHKIDNAQGRNRKWPLDLRDIPSGCYFLCLRGNGINETIKITKSN